MEELVLKVWGDFACFTRPEMKVERVSYDVMTPSAARGILEAILWKPAIRWRVKQIDVLRPVKWYSVKRNEVDHKISARVAASAMEKGCGDLGIVGSDHCIQRNALVLRDVAYLIHADFILTKNAGPSDNPLKFREMFLRRVTHGQCFHQPCMGCREFPAHFALGEDGDTPITESRDLGWMLHDIDFDGECAEPRFFRASMEQGCVTVPELDAAEVAS